MSIQSTLFAPETASDPVQSATAFPQLRYMGSKSRLLPWLHDVLSKLEFESALDAFSGSGCVAYLLKAMGKSVLASDFLNFPTHIATATVQNQRYRLSKEHVASLVKERCNQNDFIQRTFTGIFFAPEDLRFLDTVSGNLALLPNRFHRSLAIASMVRACVKRQPRGVFTVASSDERYDDGRRDIRIPLRQQFEECVQRYNEVVFDSGTSCRALRGDVLTSEYPPIDLVYMDPPYVPRADDNCYIKRYHFLEGLASYWRDQDAQIVPTTRVRKIPKRHTPFSYRREALGAFERMFEKFRHSTLVLSYSSNGYPDLNHLLTLMSKFKSDVRVHERTHRYHFGTHRRVSAERAVVREYLIVGK